MAEQHDWSPLQLEAITKVKAWLSDPDSKQVFRLFGYAGTGKSTLARHLAQGAGKVAFAAFTGKAALVMRKRGCPGASTIHSLIYIPWVDPKTDEVKFVRNPESVLNTTKLVIIDEVSMVNEQLGKDLLSFGTKVLVLGDPQQLPPVEGAGFFNGEPDVMLTEIHRQAKDNAIIRFSAAVRSDDMAKMSEIKNGVYKTVTITGSRDLAKMMEADQVLCGTNKTRQSVNDTIRQEKGLPYRMPVKGDKLVCLKNHREKALLNGQLWVVEHVKSYNENTGVITMNVRDEDTNRIVTIVTHKWFFEGREGEFSATPELRRRRNSFQEFTFGYCLTVHKSQGSQWDNVYLIDESYVWERNSHADVIKHLYTGVTRAAEEITIVRGQW